jgi:hypothetical protein
LETRRLSVLESRAIPAEVGPLLNADGLTIQGDEFMKPREQCYDSHVQGRGNAFKLPRGQKLSQEINPDDIIVGLRISNLTDHQVFPQ